MSINTITSIRILPEDSRKAAEPIGRQAWLDIHDGALKLMWYPWDIKLAREHQEFISLEPSEQKIVKYILGFFANSDKLVNDNIDNRFAAEVGIIEAGFVYDLQKVMENIHNITYSKLLTCIIQDPVEREFYSNAAINIPTVAAMADWINAAMTSDEPFSTRLFRMMIVEGVFFVSCFVYIYWLASRGKMPGLAQSNELIARDEDIHTRWGAMLYNATTVRPSREEIVAIARAGVQIAQNFAREILEGSKLSLVQMNKHIEARMDEVLAMIGAAPVFGAKSEFQFMLKLKMAGQTDFFHREVTEYTVGASATDDGEVDLAF